MANCNGSTLGADFEILAGQHAVRLCGAQVRRPWPAFVTLLTLLYQGQRCCQNDYLLHLQAPKAYSPSSDTSHGLDFFGVIRWGRTAWWSRAPPEKGFKTRHGGSSFCLQNQTHNLEVQTWITASCDFLFCLVARCPACWNCIPRKKGRKSAEGNKNLEWRLLHCAREDLDCASLDFQTKLDVETSREAKFY